MNSERIYGIEPPKIPRWNRNKAMPMTADENLHAFVVRRERELVHQIAGLKGEVERVRGQLAQREYELAEIQAIKKRLGVEVHHLTAANLVAGLALPSRTSNASVSGDIKDRYADMTIKELAVQALLDHFPNGGPLAEIRDFIQDAYGRSIMPSSLRPQMHRLKADGVLGQDPSTDTWNFRDGKRSLYAMYNHPTSRRAMRELQDEAPSGE